MQNNVFNEAQESALALSLEKGNCPLKYSYITEKGSEARDIIEKQRAKNGGNYAEYELLRDNIKTYLQDMGNPKEICFFDFGCGTGNTPKGMLEKLVKKGIKVHYHGFDISENILKLAKKNIGELGINYTFNSDTLDFESFNLSEILIKTRNKYNNIPVIGMLLGSTIGNFDSIERIILNITEALRIQDRLVIGIEKSDISNEKRMNQMIEGYKSKEAFNITFATLEYLGIKQSQGEYKIFFNNKNNSIEGFFELKKDLTIQISKNKIFFEKGDKIKILQSKKMNEPVFTKLFSDLNLRIASTRTNLKDTFIEALIGAKKY